MTYKKVQNNYKPAYLINEKNGITFDQIYSSTKTFLFRNLKTCTLREMKAIWLLNNPISLSLSLSLTHSLSPLVIFTKFSVNRRKSLNWTKEIGNFSIDIFKIVINRFLRKPKCRVFGIRRVRWLRIQLLSCTVKELKSVQFCIARGYERQRRARNATTTMQTLPLATAIVRGIMSR